MTVTIWVPDIFTFLSEYRFHMFNLQHTTFESITSRHHIYLGQMNKALRHNNIHSYIISTIFPGTLIITTSVFCNSELLSYFVMS